MSWRRLVALALAAFLLLGSVMNAFNAKTIAEYRQWGYPDRFHYLTACLEFAAAMLLLSASTRKIGLSLAALVMVAAIGTVLVHREYGHAAPPLLILVAISVLWV